MIFGLLILVLNAFIFGFIGSWHQRRLNIKNYEDAIKETKEMPREYFDSYDRFISHEPLDQALFNELQDAYIEYLRRQKEQSAHFKVAQKSPLSSGGWYFVIFGIGFSLASFGLLQKYYFEEGDITKVQITNLMPNRAIEEIEIVKEAK